MTGARSGEMGWGDLKGMNPRIQDESRALLSACWEKQAWGVSLWASRIYSIYIELQQIKELGTWKRWCPYCVLSGWILDVIRLTWMFHLHKRIRKNEQRDGTECQEPEPECEQRERLTISTYNHIETWMTVAMHDRLISIKYTKWNTYYKYTQFQLALDHFHSIHVGLTEHGVCTPTSNRFPEKWTRNFMPLLGV